MHTDIQARRDSRSRRGAGSLRRIGIGRLARATLAFTLGTFLVATTIVGQVAPYKFTKIAELYNTSGYPMIDGEGRVYFVQGTPNNGTGLMVGDGNSVWWAVEPPASSLQLRSVAADGTVLYTDGTYWPGDSTWLAEPEAVSRVLVMAYLARVYLGDSNVEGNRVDGTNSGDVNANGEAVLHVFASYTGREALLTTRGLPTYEVVATNYPMDANFYELASPRINDAGVIVFEGRDWLNGQPDYTWKVFKVTGGTTTAVYSASCTPGSGGALCTPSLNNSGKVAFKEYGACGNRIVLVDENGARFLDAKPDYTMSCTLALNDLDQVAYRGTESLPSGASSYAAITGPGLSSRRILSVGETLDGFKVNDVGLAEHALNNRGQIALCLNLSDGTRRWYGIYRADPAAELTVTKTGEGWGFVQSTPPSIDCGETCSGTFDFGRVVTLAAFGSGGSVFAGWSGEGCGGTGTCQVTMDQARNVTATFTLTPPPTVEIVGPTAMCVGQSLTLDAGPGFASYLWSPGGETTQVITVSPTTPTTYTVTVSDASGNSATSAPHTVTVESVPSALISAPILLSPNGGGNVASVPDAGPGASHSWSITGGVIESGEASSSVVFSTSSTTPVNLRVTVENAAGCSSVGSRDVSIRQCTGPLLTPQATYLTGHGNSHIAVGDFNLDGNADLVIGNIVRPSITVIFGGGQGGFGAPVEFATAYSPVFVAVADFNEDGKLDLVAADNNFVAGHGAVWLHLGDGQGAFAPPVAVSCPNKAFSFAVGDFNKDGHLDLAVVTTWSDVTVMFGDGTGAFGSPMSYTVGSSTFAIAAADLNGDGNLDLAIADRNSGQAPVLLGHGDGTFSVAGPVAISSGTISVAVADLNGDGVLDLVLGHEFDRGLSVVLGDGGGSFRAAAHFAFGEPQKIVIDDFDGDGHPDIAAAEYRGSTLKVLMGDGTGDFPATVSLPAGFLPTATAEGDFNGDGKPDLAVSNYGDYRDTNTPSLSVYLNARLSGLRPRVSGPPQVCAGHSVTLEAGLGFGSYLWSPGGETTESIMVSLTTTTSYSVTVTNTSGCSIASDPHVVAVVECPHWTLFVGKTGTGTGLVVSTPARIDCGETCSALFDDTVLVTLTATPHAGSKFVGWSGEGCSGPGTCTLTMDAAKSVTATFDLLPIAAERQALLDLYNATNGPGWSNSTNWGGPPGTECTWYGIECDGARTTVVGLWLANNNLVGTLPASLGTLTSLQVLGLDQNGLSGALPPELGNLTHLVGLGAWGNQFTGQIPNLAQLTNLMDLYLGNNSFDPGPFPAWLVSLTQLRHVWLGNCNLSGSIPASIGSLTNLETFGLGGNHLTGQIPDLSALTALTSLSLDLNPFDPGPIPSWVSTLIHLQELWLVGTNRTGPMPDLHGLTDLTALHLAGNALDPGPIPAWLGDLTQLRSLGLSSCNLTGPIPNSLASLTDLESLDFSFNQLTGAIPDLSALHNLTALYLAGNPFEPGPVPGWISTLTQLQGLGLGGTNRTGEIPPELGTLGTLHYLFLDWNHLSGSIPAELGSLTQLEALQLNGNQLIGPIPGSLTGLSKLGAGQLDLRWNALYSLDEGLTAFLNSKQAGGDWQGTQTVAPAGLSAGSATSISVALSWAPIAYTGDTGGYRVLYSTSLGGPYALYGITEDKTVSSMTVTGLQDGVTYHFVVQSVTFPHGMNNNTVESEHSTEVGAMTTPVNATPVANGQSLWTEANKPVPIALSGSDTETAPANLTFTVTAQPTHGTLTGTPPNLGYAPNSSYSGPDSFSFTVTDRGDPDNCSAPGPSCAAALTSAPATVSITVNPLNDAPVANDGAVTKPEDTAVSITLKGKDTETTSTNLAFAVTVQPTHGTLSGTAPALAYTPNPNYNGADGFSFTITDRGDPDNCGAPGPGCAAAKTSAPGTVSITVTPVNDKPVPEAKTVSTSENFPVPITLSGSDVETSAANLTFTVPGQPAHGTLSGTPPNLSYTPNFNYNGTDTIKYTVTDRGDPDNCGAPGPGCAAALTSAPATVTITVYPVNVAPVPTSTYVTKPEDAAFSITLTGSDTETARANLTFAVTVPPTHGTLSGTAPAFTYTPNPNYNGADSFSFAVMDRGDPDNCGALGIFCAAAKASAPAVVSISVTPVNDKPAADSKAVTTSENAPVSITLSGSDVETSPTNLTFTVTKVPSHGTLAGTAPYLTYTPNSNYVGIDTIKYSVMDRGDPDNCGTPGASCAAALTSGTATISITIR